MFKLSTGPNRAIHQPEDQPGWVGNTPNVQHEHATVPDRETKMKKGQAALEPDGLTPADRIPKSRLQTAGADEMKRIRGYYSKTGVNHEEIARIHAQSTGPRWWEERNKEHKPSPQRDHAKFQMDRHFHDYYGNR